MGKLTTFGLKIFNALTASRGGTGGSFDPSYGGGTSRGGTSGTFGNQGNAEAANVVLEFLYSIWRFVANAVVTVIYTIVKFALNIVDFVQYFVQKLIGIDYWQNANSDLSKLGESDILLRFLLSKEVIRVFKYIVIISIVLLIVFSIIAIIKSEYGTAVTGKTGKKGILVNALNAIFLVIIIPVMLIFGILASNAVLAGLLNAIKPENSSLTLGGQIFTASAYGANRYRNYADADERNPATYTYTLAYDVVDNGTSVTYKIASNIPTEQNSWTYTVTKYDDSGNESADGEPDPVGHMITSSQEYTPISTQTQYYTFNSLFDPIKPGDYNRFNPLYAFMYSLDEVNKDGTDIETKCYLAKFDGTGENKSIDKIAKYHYLKNVLGAQIITTNLAKWSQVNVLGLDVTFSELWEALNVGIDNALSGNKEGWISTGIVLDNLDQNHILIRCAYRTWNYARAYKSITSNFDNALTANEVTWTAQSGTTIVGNYYTNNQATWTRFDGGSNIGFVALPEEYEVMADVMDWAVKNNIQLHIVNSQSALIDWASAGVNENNYKLSAGTTPTQLCVQYASGKTVVYMPTTADTEEQGAIFLICLYDSATGKYLPVVPNITYDNGAAGTVQFHSSMLGDDQKGLVIARGVFDNSYTEQPTIITSLYSTDNGKTVSSNSAVYAVIEKGNTTTNTLTQDGMFEKITLNGEGITQLGAAEAGSTLYGVQYTLGTTIDDLDDFANNKLDALISAAAAGYTKTVTGIDTAKIAHYASNTAANVSFDIYINTNKIVIISYQNLLANETAVSAKDALKVGADLAGNVYVNLRGKTFMMKEGNLDGRGYYYIDSATRFDQTEYKISLYNAFAYYKDTAGWVSFRVSDLRKFGNTEDDGESADILGTLKVITSAVNIENSSGTKILSGVDLIESGTSKYSTYKVYLNGEVVMQVTVNKGNPLTRLSFDQVIGLQGTDANGNYIQEIKVGSKTYYSVPVYTAEVAQKGDRLKPVEVSFSQDKIKSSIISADLSVVNGYRFYIKLLGGAIHTTQDDLVARANNSTIGLTYNDFSLVPLSSRVYLNNIYSPADINIIVLIFATVLVFKILMQSAWGMIKRIYDIVILFMVMPGFASTMVFDDKRFSKWKDNLIKSIFSAYGVMIGLNIFFVLVPVISNATSNIFTKADLPETIASNPIFARVDLLNELVSLMFTLVALTLLQTLPGYISGMLDFGDVYGDGEKVKKSVDKMVKETGDTVSGRNAREGLRKAFYEKDKDANNKRKFTASLLGSFIPGGSLMSSFMDSRKKAAQAAQEKAAKKSAGGSNPMAAPASEAKSKSTDTANSAAHAFNSDTAGTARGLNMEEADNIKDGTGTNNNNMAAFVNKDKAEQDANNAMVRFINSDPNDKNRPLYYRDYADATDNLMKTNVGNAMATGGGSFDVCDRDVNNMAKHLGDKFEYTAYRTGNKDAEGKNIWAVSVREKTEAAEMAKFDERLGRVDKAIDERKAWISDFDFISDQKNQNDYKSAWQTKNEASNKLTNLGIEENKLRMQAASGIDTSAELKRIAADRMQIQNQVAAADSVISVFEQKQNAIAGKDRAKVEAELSNIVDKRKEIEGKKYSAGVNAKAKAFETDRDNAMARYAASTKQLNNINGLEKALGSGIDQSNKDRAVNTYIKTYYGNKTQAEQDKVKADISSGKYFEATRNNLHQDLARQEAIANGAQVQINRIRHTNVSAPIGAKQPQGTTPANTSTSAGGATAANYQPLANPVTPKPVAKPTMKTRITKVGNSIKNTAKGAVTNVQNAGKYVKETFTGKRSQGDKLGSLYRKHERAIAIGDTERAAEIGAKMVNVAGKSQQMREKADTNFIKKVNRTLNTNYTTVEEAQTAASVAKVAPKAKVNPDGHVVKTSAQVQKDLIKAENKRRAVNQSSKLGTNIHASRVGDQKFAMELTKQYAKQGLNEDLKTYGDAVSKSTTKKSRKKVDAAGLSDANRAGAYTAEINQHGSTKQKKKLETQQTKLKNTKSARSIKALNTDDHI